MQYETDPSVAEKIINYCRSEKSRFVGEWQEGHPSKWEPNKVSDPSSGDFFTDSGAWEFIAHLIETDHALRVVDMKEPKGKIGHEIILEIEPGLDLYIKVVLNNKSVVGRSFHYSNRN